MSHSRQMSLCGRVVDNLVKNAVERIRNPSNDRVEDLHFVRLTIKRLRQSYG
jgi:hypothetical protein